MENNTMNLLNSIFSNPEAIDNIKDIINNSVGNSKDNKTQQIENQSQPEENDMTFIKNLLEQNQDGELLKKISSAYNVYANKSTPSIKLLEALTPYLSGKRVSNLGKIKTAVRISNAVSEFNRK